MTQSQSTSEFGPDFVLDTNSLAYIRNPYPTYRWLQEHAPVYIWPRQPIVVFSRYRDVKAILGDARFTADFHKWEHARERKGTPAHDAYNLLIKNGFLCLAESDHARVRKLANVALTPRSLERIRGEIQHAVDEVMDAAIQGDRLNLRTFTDALPIRVICDMLKIPDEFRAEFLAFARATIQTLEPSLSPEAFAQTIAEMPNWVSMLREVIDRRRKNPLPDDFMSMLIAACDGEARLSENELLGIIQALITAGTESTAHSICFSAYTLLRHPQALEQIKADRTLLRNANEECLRFDSFAKSGFIRFCLQAMEYNNLPLRRGQMVCLLLGAANHDPEVFPDPERFDIHRDLSRTLSFGMGMRFCLGAALARMEIDLSINTLIERFPAVKLLEEPAFEHHFLFRTMSKLLLQLH